MGAAITTDLYPPGATDVSQADVITLLIGLRSAVIILMPSSEKPQ